MKKNGFTSIELIIVILLIIIIIAFDIILVLYLNQKNRDLEVLTDIKQIQSGLDVYLIKNSKYPLADEPVILNDVYAGTEKLCVEGFKKLADKCSQIILQTIPNSDLLAGNIYKYQSIDGQSYQLEFILKSNFKDLDLKRGQNCVSNNQILSQPCF